MWMNMDGTVHGGREDKLSHGGDVKIIATGEGGSGPKGKRGNLGDKEQLKVVGGRHGRKKVGQGGATRMERATGEEGNEPEGVWCIEWG